jgi:glycosyltransferase involved in cell wall biosynthesis
MRLNWFGFKFIAVDGYGRYSLYMIRALTRLGVSVYPGTIDEVEWPGWMHQLRGLQWDRLSIQLMPGNHMTGTPGNVWGYSMHEDTALPDGWAENINEVCQRLLVPCEHNKQVFERGGVDIPVDVIPGGTSPEEFPILPCVKHERPYTFLCMGDRGVRKGIERSWAAFYQAFDTNPDVRLVIKSRKRTFPGGVYGLQRDFAHDPRIVFWNGDTETMADVYPHGDVFLYPALCEGWGMPPREAAMMGLPVIATRYSGLEDGIDHYAIPINKFEMQNSTLDYSHGKWASPDIDEIAEHMVWCYENRDAARQKGLEAANWLRENQTWEHSAKQLIRLIERHG